MRRSRAASAGASPRSPSTTSPPTAASRGPRCTGCSPAARTCCSTRCASASSRTSSPCCRAEVEGADSSRTCSCAPSSSATRELRADEHLALMLGVRAGRDAQPAHRRRPAADHPHADAYLVPAGRARTSSRTSASRWSTCSPASSSRTSSPRATTSTSATRTRRGRSSAPSSPSSTATVHHPT